MTPPTSGSAVRQISGNVVDPLARRIFPATLTIRDGRIAAIHEDPKPHPTWLLPGFVDAHVHVESSLLPPCEFARLAVVHGTVATVSDPHEIANVLGIPGVEFMLADAARSPFHFHFGAPSCVPATAFDRAGAMLDAVAVAALDGTTLWPRLASATPNAFAARPQTAEAFAVPAGARLRVIDARGGLAAVDGGRADLLPLPIAGLMSDLPGTEVAARYAALDRFAKDLGSELAAPFMTLAFMALLVIPALKLAPQGLFDVEQFAPVGLFVPAE